RSRGRGRGHEHVRVHAHAAGAGLTRGLADRDGRACLPLPLLAPAGRVRGNTCCLTRGATRIGNARSRWQLAGVRLATRSGAVLRARSYRFRTCWTRLTPLWEQGPVPTRITAWERQLPPSAVVAEGSYDGARQ